MLRVFESGGGGRRMGAERPMGGRLVLAATLLTLAIAAPVVISPTERIFGTEVAGRHHDPFTVMRQFAGVAVQAPYLQPVTDWSGRALAHVLPPVAAYNVVVLLSFPLAALFAYWLAFAVTRSRFAAAVTGLGFAFSPFHVAHAAYHAHIAQVQWIALYLLALWLCLHGFTAARGLLLATAAGLVAASNFYGGFIALVMTPVVVPLFWLTVPLHRDDDARRPSRGRDQGGRDGALGACPSNGWGTVGADARHGDAGDIEHIVAEQERSRCPHAARNPKGARQVKTRRMPRRRDLFATSGVLAALGVTSLMAMHLLAPDVLYRSELLGADYEDLYRYSARWWAHFVPPVDHALLGGWAQELWRRFGIGDALLEQQLYLGFGVAWLAAIAGVQWLRGKVDGGVRAVPALAAIAVVAVVCALSPSREVAGWQVVRPSAVLYDLVPMFRSYARFSVVVSLMATLLAGIGAASLWRSGSRAARAVVVVLLAVVVFEYAPLPWRSRDVLPTSAHRWLAAREGKPRAFDCAEMTLADRATAWLAGYPLVHAGASGPDCGAPSLDRQLAAAGMTHLIVRFDSPAWPLLRERTRPGLRIAYQGAGAVVFEVLDQPPRAFVDGMSGWYAREYDGARTWRWTSGRASLRVWSPGGAARAAALELELASFPAPRRVVVAVNDEPVADLLVAPTRAMHVVDAIVLRPGRNVVELTTDRRPVTPHSLDPSDSDRRALAFQLGTWTLSVLPSRR